MTKMSPVEIIRDCCDIVYDLENKITLKSEVILKELYSRLLVEHKNKVKKEV